MTTESRIITGSLAGPSEVLLRRFQGRFAKAGVSHLAEPALVYALDQVMDRGARCLYTRRILEPFEAARRAQPGLTLADFFARGTPEVRALGEQLFGTDGFTLVTLQGGRGYFDAWKRVMDSFRHAAPPTTFGPAWGHWSTRSVTLGANTTTPHVVPIDFPARRVDGDTVTWVYPRWDTIRMRAYVLLGHMELARALGKDVPLDLRGAALFDWAGLGGTRVTPLAFAAHPDLRMSRTQMAQMLSTGRAPAFQSQILPVGATRPKGLRHSAVRNAEDASWELARRFSDARFVDPATFEAAVADHAAALLDTSLPSQVNPAHLVTTVSPADLLRIARSDPGAPQIVTMVWELEHQRAQRSVRSLESMLAALDTTVDTSLIRNLCGLGDPHNLALVTPYGHAARDMYAAMMGSGQRWSVNGARLAPDLALAGNTSPVAPAMPATTVSDQVPAGFNQEFDSHDDYPRAMNVFFGFTPRELDRVARMLSGAPVADLLARYDATRATQVRETYNHLAGCMNAAINSYQLDKTLLLDFIPL
ncbi:MAG: hypothetical protein IT355_06735 [Gemmatimonadaceae bacterium]|nr:hypothetical protein [Gemmatimonadaceae bacterium]